jgi:hypothetical protein
VINPAASNLPNTFRHTSQLMKITFGGGYSVMTQRFTCQGG